MTTLLIALVAFVASAVNAVAGGGTFLAFPALTGLGGLTEKAANVACTIGLWPGSLSAVVPARKEIAGLHRPTVIGYALLCILGGALGSTLLLKTSAHAFSLAIPWLLGFATIVFAIGPRIARVAGRADHANPSFAWTLLVGIVQLVVAIYGGYFGAGIGVLTLAGLSLSGLGDLKKLNALKVLLSTCTNLSAAVIFLFGPVEWHFVGPMALASAMGGFVGMLGAQRLPQRALRAIILVIGALLTAAYFWKTFGVGPRT